MGVVVVIVFAERLYVLCSVRPLMFTDSTICDTERASDGFERVTSRLEVTVEVSPLGIRTVPEEIGASIPNRGSGPSVIVVVVPSGPVVEVVKPSLRWVVVVSAAGSVTLMVSLVPDADV